VILSWRST